MNFSNETCSLTCPRSFLIVSKGGIFLKPMSVESQWRCPIKIAPSKGEAEQQPLPLCVHLKLQIWNSFCAASGLIIKQATSTAYWWEYFCIYGRILKLAHLQWPVAKEFLLYFTQLDWYLLWKQHPSLELAQGKWRNFLYSIFQWMQGCSAWNSDSPQGQG